MVNLPIVKALAKMTAERMKTISEALFSTAMSFLMKSCPQNPAKIETNMRYNAAEIKKQ